MNTIVVILNALKIDKTVFIQFALLVLFFNTIAVLFFNRIKTVLELRENKTTNLENNAHAVYKQADELSEQYKAKIEKTHNDSQNTSQNKKTEAMGKERELLKTAEEKINNEYEERKAIILKEMTEKKITVMAEAEKLSANLIEKLTK